MNFSKTTSYAISVLSFLADLESERYSAKRLNVFSTCIMGFQKCPFNHTCAMHEVWTATRESILKVLNNTTLALLKQA
jgi:DNA-binding IscR family transcriptional regulator